MNRILDAKKYVGCNTDKPETQLDYMKLYNQINSNVKIFDCESELYKKRRKNFHKFIPNEIKKAAKLFDDFNIKLNDVDYIDYNALDAYDAFYGDEKDFIEKGKPTNISLFGVDSITVNGDYKPNYTEVDYTSDKEDKNIVFTGVGIERNNYDLCKAYYNNVITRIELDNIKGSYLSYLNSDVLPIFMEFLTGLTNNTYKELKALRLSQLSYSIRELYFFTNCSDEAEIEAYKDITSIIKAIELMDYYLSLDVYGRRDLLQFVNAILTGDLTVESIIYQYNLEDLNNIDTKTLIRI